MSSILKLLLVLFVLLAAFLIGYSIGFSYVSDNPGEAFRLETWRTFFQQLQTF